VSDPLLVREYVHQIVDHTLNVAVSTTLSMLLRFQDKLHAVDSAKARAKRRVLVGLRETVRSLRTGKAKCVIVAHNVEQISAEGALDDLVLDIIRLSRLKYNPLIEKHPEIQLEV
jgi:selenocysteine insertion sequence-binding protein 2